MTELSFDLPLDFDLPVEVLDGELRRVGRVLSSDSVSVEPGTYLVEAHLPDGSQLQQAVEVGGEEELKVSLRPRREPESSRVMYVTLGDSVQVSDAAEVRLSSLYSYRDGRSGGGRAKAERERVVLAPGTEVHPQPGVTALALRGGLSPKRIIPVPRRHSFLLRYEVYRPREGELALRAGLADAAADALLGFLNRDRLEDAGLMAPATAEGMLCKKLRDPFAAVVGAHALLRLNELERLHDWTANLSNWYPWLPDGAIVHAEHLGREGEHEEAARLLRGIPKRGLPIFSLSLALAVDRLRTYVAHWGEEEGLGAALFELTRYALATDFSAPVTTFTGAAPDSPDPARPFGRPLGWGRPGAAAVVKPAREIVKANSRREVR